MHRGTHLLIDCRRVSRDVCLNDGLVLDAMAAGARKAGANVLSQVRYHFGHNSPPGFTAAIVLDESHCTAHSYADLGLIAMDVFTCGDTSPYDVLKYIREQVDLGEVSVREIGRFETDESDEPGPCACGSHAPQRVDRRRNVACREDDRVVALTP